ncbi:MAG TPA: NAD(P)-dependent oxidoreductase [Gemmatimonadales bacterium]|nr:NAD(P)-dependent oxidoreductase [Gemmatimonadales bacterium]
MAEVRRRRGESNALSFAPGDEVALEDALSAPDDGLAKALEACPGDFIVLGAGGKMGPTLSRMARRALNAAGRNTDRVIAVSRWTDESARASLESFGVHTIRADLADRDSLASLPDAPNVVFMAGQKFGTHSDPGGTWLLNAVVPYRCAERFRGARTVVFSTGNVYPLVPASGPGSREGDTLMPTGEYASSCVARERLYELASEGSTPLAIVRLNYAVDLRYGVLVDLALRVLANEPVDLTMGWVNAIWQGDANRMALAALAHAGTPPVVFNVTGTEHLSVRAQATELAALLDRSPKFVGEEAATALLSDASRMIEKLGKPSTSASRLLAWTAEWISGGGRVLAKPTHFEVRDGTF